MNFKKGLALFLCLAILLSSGAGAAFASVKISAKLISMDGDVQVIRAGGEKPFKAFVNMRLTEGDRIITGSNGTAKVQMEDDVIITLAENTRIYLSELRGSQGAQQSSINLQSGAVGSSVGKKLTDNSRFEIKTPTAVMGVRGTEFFTQYYNGNVDVRVVNGTVEVSVSVTSTGNIAGPGATAVQTYTFPVTSLQQVNFGEETPLSQLQQQPPQPLGLIGMPQPFLDRIQEISQQSPGVIPPEIINTIDQAVESARISIQNRMDNPNIVPSELESFIAGRIEGSLFPGLPNFGLPPMLIMPPPPSFFPGGGGPTVDFGGDDGGTTPVLVDFFMHREMEIEFHEDSDNQYNNYLNITLTFNRPVDPSSLLDNPFTLQAITAPITNGSYIASIGDEPNQVILSRVSYRDLPCKLENYAFVVAAPSGIKDTQGNSINGTREAIYAADFLSTTASGDEFTQISPGTSANIGNLYIKENEIHALIPGRTIELNLRENAIWTTAPVAAVTTGDKITIGLGTIINDGDTVQYTLAGSYSTDEVTITFSGGAIEAELNPGNKDVNVTFAGTSTGVEGTIKVAQIEAAGSIDHIAVSKLSVDPTDASLIASGDTLTITPTITPVNATNQNVIWSSTYEGVATVSNGVVTPIAAGSTYIEAKAEDNVEITSRTKIEVKAGVTATLLDYQAQNLSAVVSLVGDTFSAKAVDSSKWIIYFGNTEPSEPVITLQGEAGQATGVTINFTGTAASGTLTITPKAEALSSGIQGETIGIEVVELPY